MCHGITIRWDISWACIRWQRHIGRWFFPAGISGSPVISVDTGRADERLENNLQFSLSWGKWPETSNLYTQTRRHARFHACVRTFPHPHLLSLAFSPLPLFYFVRAGIPKARGIIGTRLSSSSRPTIWSRCINYPLAGYWPNQFSNRSFRQVRSIFWNGCKEL